tara:strand:+ start:475 stop:1074 length:600 start_codon:yes stop_codon:yes gene_type:complete
MADGLVKMSDQFSGLPMSDLIGGPLQAACDAQVMLAKATADFVQNVGMEQIDSKYVARTVDFQFDRPKTNQDGTATTETVDLKVPLLAILNTPSLSVKEATVNFTMSVSSSTTEEDSSDSAGSYSGSASVGFGPFKAKVTVSGSVASHSSNTRKSDNSAKYDVSVIARDDGPPEGLMKVLDMLNSAIAPVAISSGVAAK